jgi:hypothetical protein
MRKFILILAFGFIGTCSFSQALKKEQVPQLIKNAVQFVFPQTLDVPVSWSRENGLYKANLIVMDSPALMLVDSLGKTKRIERRIHETYLPEKAKKHLKTLDPNYQIVMIMQITDEKGKITYKTSARIKTDFVYDGGGNLTDK